MYSYVNMCINKSLPQTSTYLYNAQPHANGHMYVYTRTYLPPFPNIVVCMFAEIYTYVYRIFHFVLLCEFISIYFTIANISCCRKSKF